MECLGCRIANGIEPNVNIVYENEHIACVLDIDPFHEGHTLILPKRHYIDVDELPSGMGYAIMDASRKLSIVLKALFRPDGITICQNGGGFNDLTHYHMHLIPRYKGDGFSWSEPLHPHDAASRLAETRLKIMNVIREQEADAL